MSDLLLARLMDENNNPLPFNAEHVVHPVTEEKLTDFMERMEQLKAMVDAFLTGEDNANEVIDRLSEIVAAIKSNKDLINAAVNGSLKPADIINDLVTGGANKVLSAEQGKALKALIDQIHVFANAAILDKIGQDEQGALTYDGKPIKGETGIAIGSTAAEATNYNGKIKIILEKVTPATPDKDDTESTE